MAQDKSQAPRIIELAATLSSALAHIQHTLVAQGVPLPSFSEYAPTTFPREIEDARDIALDAAAEIYDLLLEPMTLIYRHGAHNNNVCLQFISRFRVSDYVPVGGSISFADLAGQIGVAEQTTRRILRHAMTHRIFCEPAQGYVSHTMASKMLQNPILNDWVKCGTHEMWPAGVNMIDAIQKWPESCEPSETGFSLANKTNEPMYRILAKEPARADLFANAMKIYNMKHEYDLAYVTDYYDWASLGTAHVVDVGGSQGHVSIALAERFPHLKFTVQDLDTTVENGAALLPAELKSRIQFHAHDFFSPQDVEADVYFLRWILHNWSDKYAAASLRALIPKLKPGTKIILQDAIMPEPGSIPLHKEQDLRASDLHMTNLFNARERTIEEWKKLITDADPRFILKNIIEPKGSALSLLDIVWEE